MAAERTAHAANEFVVKFVLLLGILEQLSTYFRQKALHFQAAGKKGVPKAAPSPALARHVFKGEGSAFPDPNLKREEFLCFVSGAIHLIGGVSFSEAKKKLRVSPGKLGRTPPVDAVWLPAVWNERYLDTLAEGVKGAAETIEVMLDNSGEGTSVEGITIPLLRAQLEFLWQLHDELEALS